LQLQLQFQSEEQVEAIAWVAWPIALIHHA